MSVKRLGVYAAIVLFCFLATSAAWGIYAKEFLNADDFAEGALQRLEYSIKSGGLVLSRTQECIPIIWIPSESEGTVSKIDARTNRELAIYRLAPPDSNPMPCSVAVDGRGNAYIACSNIDKAGMIVKITADGIIDANKDGRISTCFDVNDDKLISRDEMLPYGSDDAISRIFEIGGINSYPRAIAFDSNGYLWAALWGRGTVAKLNISTGKTEAEIIVDGRPTGLTSGKNGDLWVICEENATLNRIDTITNSLADIVKLKDCIPGGIAFDGSDKIWIGNLNGGLVSLEYGGLTQQEHTSDCEEGYGSVCIDSIGDIWAVSPNTGKIARFSGEDGNLLQIFENGGYPISVCSDENGFVWVLNQDKNKAYKINTHDTDKISELKTHLSPISTTAFISQVVRYGFFPNGEWRTIVDGGSNGFEWGLISWDFKGLSDDLTVEVRAADNLRTFSDMPFKQAQNGKTLDKVAGRYLEVFVKVKGNGISFPIFKSMRVEGMNHAPDVSSAMANITKAISSDETIVQIEIQGIKDPDGDEFKVEITNVNITQGDCISEKASEKVCEIAFNAIDTYGATSCGCLRAPIPRGILMSQVFIYDGHHYNSSKVERTLIARVNVEYPNNKAN